MRLLYVFFAFIWLLTGCCLINSENEECPDHPTSIDELKQSQNVNYYVSCKIEEQWAYSYFCEGESKLSTHTMESWPYHPSVAYDGFFPGVYSFIPMYFSDSNKHGLFHFTIPGDSLQQGSNCIQTISLIPSYNDILPNTKGFDCRNIGLSIPIDDDKSADYIDYKTKMWIDTVEELEFNGAPILFGRFESTMINNDNKFDTIQITDGIFKLTYL